MLSLDVLCVVSLDLLCVSVRALSRLSRGDFGDFWLASGSEKKDIACGQGLNKDIPRVKTLQGGRDHWVSID